MDGILDLLEFLGNLLHKFIKIITLLVIFIAGAEFFGSILFETYRLNMIVDDVNTVMTIASESAERRFQETFVEDFLYDGLRLSGTYENYLDTLASEGYAKIDSNLVAITELLRGHGSSDVIYTPLNFDLSYLDPDILSEFFLEDTTMLMDSMNTFNPQEGSNVGGAILEKVFVGDDRVRIEDAYVEVMDFKILDVTDMSTVDDYTRGVYAQIFGTTDPAAGALTAPNLDITGRRYLVVYDLKYVIKWSFFGNTTFTKLKDIGTWNQGVYVNPGMHNINDYGKGPVITTEFARKYCITN